MMARLPSRPVKDSRSSDLAGSRRVAGPGPSRTLPLHAAKHRVHLAAGARLRRGHRLFHGKARLPAEAI